MDINLQALGLPVPQSLPSAGSADTLPVKTASAASAAPALPQRTAGPDLSAAEEQRFARLEEAARHFFKDVYAVSDTTFTIFKDATGQYVTRFTSLRDGRVTYMPEPRVLDYMQRKMLTRQQAIVKMEV